MTTTVQGIGKPAGTSWPEMRVTASLYNSSDVFQSSISITPNLDGSWSQVLAATAAGTYQVIRETDSVGARTWKITVPASGTYKVVDILWVSPSGSVSYGTTTGTATEGNDARVVNAVQQDKLVYHADAHGILGDGSTDDTTAINALITTVNAAGGGKILFTAGKTYLFGKTVTVGGSGASINLKSNVWLEGPGATLKFRNGIAVDVTTSYFPIWASSVNNVRISDINVIGNSANNTTALVCDMITLSGCDNAQVRGVNITDGVDSGVMFADCTNSILDNVRIATVRDLGIYISDTSNGTITTENIVRGCRVSGAPNGGIALKRGAQKFTVVDNTIYNCGNGITMEQGAAAYFGHDSIISNNRLRHIGYIGTTEFYGIDLRGCDYVQCTNNRIEDVVNHAINLAAARYTTVRGNVINGTTGTLADGIRVQDYPTLITTYGSTNCVISNNIVNTVTGDGINFVASASGTKNQYITVTGNQFMACAHDGIEANANLADAIVTENVFEGTVTDVSMNASTTNIRWWGNIHTTNSAPTTTGVHMRPTEDFRPGQGVILGNSSATVQAAATIPLYLRGSVSNNSSAVGNWLGNGTTLTTAGGRIAGFCTDTAQTHASPKAYIGIDGSYEFAAAGNKLISGTGSPEGVTTAPVGSIFLRTDGSTNTTHYRKETGSGNTGWVASSAASGTGQMDATVAALKPTAAHFETFPRTGTPLASNVTPGNSGTLYLQAIYLPAGEVVSSISFRTGTLGVSVPTNYWFGLYDATRVQLAVTADQTTAAWAATTTKTLSIATIASGSSSTYTVPTSGLYYIGFMIACTTMPNIIGYVQSSGITAMAPVTLGSSDTAQTTPPAFAHTATALSGVNASYYAYTS